MAIRKGDSTGKKTLSALGLAFLFGLSSGPAFSRNQAGDTWSLNEAGFARETGALEMGVMPALRSSSPFAPGEESQAKPVRQLPCLFAADAPQITRTTALLEWLGGYSLDPLAADRSALSPSHPWGTFQRASFPPARREGRTAQAQILDLPNPFLVAAWKPMEAVRPALGAFPHQAQAPSPAAALPPALGFWLLSAFFLAVLAFIPLRERAWVYGLRDQAQSAFGRSLASLQEVLARPSLALGPRKAALAAGRHRLRDFVQGLLSLPGKVRFPFQIHSLRLPRPW